MGPVSRPVQQRLQFWRRTCAKIAVLGSVQQGTNAALRNKKKVKSLKLVMTVLQRQLECTFFRSRSYDGDCLPHRCGAVLQRARKVSVIPFQKQI